MAAKRGITQQCFSNPLSPTLIFLFHFLKIQEELDSHYPPKINTYTNKNNKRPKSSRLLCDKDS